MKLPHRLSLLMIMTAACCTIAPSTFADTWESIAPLPAPNAGFVAGWVKGKLVIAGGTNWQDGVKHWLDKTWEYDPATNQWSAGPDLPRPVAYGAFGSDGDRLWMAGGADGRQARAEVLVLGDDRKWTHVGTMNQAVSFASGAMAGDRLWIYGGTPDPDDWQKVTSELRSITKKGAEEAASPLRRTQPGTGLPAMAGINGKLYAFTGAWLDSASGHVQNSNESNAYDIPAQTWKTLAPYPVTARGVTAVPLDAHHIYLAGGYGTDAEGFLDAAYLYDVRTNAYTPAAPLPLKALTCLVKGDGFIYALGGEDQKKHRTAACFRVSVQDLQKQK